MNTSWPTALVQGEGTPDLKLAGHQDGPVVALPVTEFRCPSSGEHLTGWRTVQHQDGHRPLLRIDPACSDHAQGQ